MTAYRTTYILLPRVRLTGRIRQAALAAWRAYVKWYNRRAAYHYLSGLDDRMLQDIGISRSQIESALRDGRLRRRM